MTKTFRKYLIFMLLIYSPISNAQFQVIKYPVRFAQYYNCYYMINPASTGSCANFDISMGNLHMLGNYSKISTYYLAANARIEPRRNNKYSSFSALGIFAYNDREGKYLNRSRFYASYAWHGSITKKIKVSGGFHLGAMNYSVKGTPLTGDGSDIAPDGAVGVKVYSNKFNIGVSYNQIFNSSIQPLEEIARLSPFTNIDGYFIFDFGNQFSLTPSASFRIPVNDDDNIWDFTLLADYSKKIALAVGIYDNSRLMNTVEIRNLLMNEFSFNFSITYCYPIAEQVVNTNFIELGIRILR